MPRVGKLIKKVIKFQQQVPVEEKDARLQQNQTFKKLISKSKDTAFGRIYKFDEVLTATYDIALFQKVVPIHTYEEINKKWWKHMRNGEKDVCWPGIINYYAVSSGTTDASSKYIPVSKKMIKSVRKASMKQIYSLYKYPIMNNLFSKEVLMIGGTSKLEQKGMMYYGDMSGISAMHAIPKWFKKHYYKPGVELNQITDWELRIDAIVKQAPQWDIGIICGIPSWIKLLFERLIDYYQIDTILEIWPNLSVYIHGGIFIDPYKESIEKLVGKKIIYSETYMASEGFFGFTTSTESTGIKLLLKNGVFYEFIPFNESNFTYEGQIIGNPKSYLIDEVNENIEYAIVITNNSGAWRYLIGDTIKFTNKKLAEINITGRIQHFLNLCDEHVSCGNLNETISQLSKKLNMNISEFSVMDVQEKGKFYHHWFIESDTNLSEEKVALRLDDILQNLNDDYKTVRSNLLSNPKLTLIEPGTFHSWLEENGKVGNQFKVPRVLQKRMKTNWMQFLQKILQPVA